MQVKLSGVVFIVPLRSNSVAKVLLFSDICKNFIIFIGLLNPRSGGLIVTLNR